MRSIPTITKNLLIINFLAFIAMLVIKSGSFPVIGPMDLNDICGLHFFMAPDFQVYQLFTYMFMHAGWEHIIFNMFALWMFGCIIERVWGPKKFLFYYISCGVGAGLFQELAQFIQVSMAVSDQGASIMQINPVVFNGMTTVGASGAIYAILLAFGMIFPNEKLFVFPIPIPIKAKWFVMGYAAIELFSALATSNDNVAHIAHLGGMVFGFFMIRYWNKHPASGYGKDSAEDTMNKFKNMFGGRKNKQQKNNTNSSTCNTDPYSPSNRQSDWNYNAQKKMKQDEIDRILDKIRRSGYDSLTKDEKQKLFDQKQ